MAARCSASVSPSLAVDALGTAGLPFESAGEDAEDDDATTWNIDYLYDVGLMIGGGSNNIQKNIIAERGLDLPREPKSREGLMEFALSRGTTPVRQFAARSAGGPGADRTRCAATRRSGSGFDADYGTA